MANNTAADLRAQLRQTLSEEHAGLVAQLVELGFRDGVAEGLEYDSGFADTSQVTAERGEAAALASQLQETLDEVNHALAKIDGTPPDGGELKPFGVCESCGQEIAADRLEAMPAARFCITCASARR